MSHPGKELLGKKLTGQFKEFNQKGKYYPGKELT